MGKHKSQVNFVKLIKDLAEMYPFPVDEVILVELIANCLDAKATEISVFFDENKPSLIVKDNGIGMTKRQFEQYHDLAAELKVKGKGIGFAGLGAKISFNIAKRVITETYNKNFSGASDWYFDNKNSLIWEDKKQETMRKYGTKVEIIFRKDTQFSFNCQQIPIIIQRHYLPLLDKNFLKMYSELNMHSKSLKFKINGKSLNNADICKELGLKSIEWVKPKRKIDKKIVGYGFFGVADVDYPLCDDICGVLLCTYGKVVRSDWLNQYPGPSSAKILGVVEIPRLIDYLTANKIDFIKKGASVEKLIDPIRQEFKKWLKEQGFQTVELIETDESKLIEKEIKKIINEIPELMSMFGTWGRGHILSENSTGDAKAEISIGGNITFPTTIGSGRGEIGPYSKGDSDEQILESAKNGSHKAKPIGRSLREGPRISFVDAKDRLELSWIEGNYIYINTGQPSFIKNKNIKTAKMLHYMLSIACAVMRYRLDDDGLNMDESPRFIIDRIMNVWGKK